MNELRTSLEKDFLIGAEQSRATMTNLLLVRPKAEPRLPDLVLVLPNDCLLCYLRKGILYYGSSHVIISI